MTTSLFSDGTRVFVGGGNLIWTVVCTLVDACVVQPQGSTRVSDRVVVCQSDLSLVPDQALLALLKEDRID